MPNNEGVTPEKRAKLFATGTRQNFQMLPSKNATEPMSTLQWELPKTRLLAKVLLDFEIELTIKHASKTNLLEEVKDKTLYPYSLINKVALNVNNGFNPFVIGGKELALLNMVKEHSEVIKPVTDASCEYCNAPLKASSAGVKNTISFMLELETTLNERDAIGLILLQNAQTYSTVEVTIGNPAEIVKDPTGFTFTVNNVKISPMLTTFSIPATTPDAFPDLSVLKLVNSRTESFVGAGPNVVKMETGNIYRKLLMYVTDENGNPVEYNAIDSNIEIVFNQADCNYSISPKILRKMNEMQVGHAMPKGLFFFDFSYQGLANLGGARDYIDTEKLTEMWIRFSTKAAGKVSLISEKISRLSV